MKIHLSIAAVALATVVPFSTVSAQEVTLSLGHVHNEQGTFHIFAEYLADLLDEKSNGRIAVDIYPNSSLGGEVRMVQSVRSGTLDMTFTSDAALESTVTEFGVLSIPYLFDGIDHVNEVLLGEAGTLLLDSLGSYGMQGLSWVGNYERNVAATVPVLDVEDIGGLKLRVPQSMGYIAGYEALGAQPTPMAYGEIYMALQSGVVDGIDSPPLNILTDGLADLVTDYSITRMTYSKTLLVISQARYLTLPEDLRAILNEAAQELSVYALDMVSQLYYEALEDLAGHGVAIHEPDIAPFREATRHTWDALIGDNELKQRVVEEVTQD